MPTWIDKLDGGQLDLMWNFLRFKGDGVKLKEFKRHNPTGFRQWSGRSKRGDNSVKKL